MKHIILLLHDFKYLFDKFKHLSDVEIKKSIFVGVDTRRLIQHIEFRKTMSKAEVSSRKSFM